MRIEFDGADGWRVPAPATDVLEVLSDPHEVHAMLEGMMHPTSTVDRWVVADLHVGFAAITPAVDVTITPDGRRVRIVGVPVPGHTPAHLLVTLAPDAYPDDPAHSVVRSTWRVTVDVPGPQFLAATIHPLLVASSRSVTRRLGDRVHARFAGLPS